MWMPDLSAGYLFCARPEDGTFHPAPTPEPSLWKAQPGRGVHQTSTASPHPPAQNVLACIYKHLLPVLLPQDTHTRCSTEVAESKRIPAAGAAHCLPKRFPSTVRRPDTELGIWPPLRKPTSQLPCYQAWPQAV